MSEKTTTLEAYKADADIIKNWSDQNGLSMKDFFRAWIVAVRQHKQREMYSRLSMPSDYKKTKPLENVRVNKRLTIEVLRDFYRKNKCN
jgi:hypothetical protein